MSDFLLIIAEDGKGFYINTATIQCITYSEELRKFELHTESFEARINIKDQTPAFKDFVKTKLLGISLGNPLCDDFNLEEALIQNLLPPDREVVE